MEVTPELGTQIAKLAGQNRRRAKKESASRSAPLPLPDKRQADKGEGSVKRQFVQRWERVAGGLSEAAQLQAVRQAIEVFELLPAGSTYARHRLKVLRTALQLLEEG
jgi:hypothetical protein